MARNRIHDTKRSNHNTIDALQNKALTETGFDVSLYQNVTRDQMLKALLDFDADLRNADTGLFYFAGHAMQVDGRNFMLPDQQPSKSLRPRLVTERLRQQRRFYETQAQRIGQNKHAGQRHGTGGQCR